MKSKEKKDSILLFIPAYNCETQIVRVLKKLSSSRALSYLSGILIVENRSQDKTLPAAIRSARNLKKPVAVLQNNANYNLGGSHKVAFNYAINNNYDYLITLHGDDQADIEDLLSILSDGSYRNFSSLLGSRFDKRSVVSGYSRYRIYGNYLVNLVCSMVTQSKITDTGSGLNMYKVTFLKKCRFDYFPDDLTFNVYLLLFTIYTKSVFAFFPITWREDDQVSNAKVIKQGMHILGLFARYFVAPSDIFPKMNGKPLKQYFSILVYEQ
ncbi:MAG: glycosyltransferase family 2 protein [Patescibacteria group bacterium]